MHVDTRLAFSQFVGSLPIFVAVILGWIQTNARISDLRQDMDRRFDMLLRHIDDTRDMLRREFRRVEEVMDARLKHLEER